MFQNIPQCTHNESIGARFTGRDLLAIETRLVITFRPPLYLLHPMFYSLTIPVPSAVPSAVVVVHVRIFLSTLPRGNLDTEPYCCRPLISLRIAISCPSAAGDQMVVSVEIELQRLISMNRKATNRFGQTFGSGFIPHLVQFSSPLFIFLSPIYA